MVLGLFFVFLFFGCTLERDNPYDPNGTNYNPSLYPSSSSLAPNSSSSFSSSSLPDSLVPCKHDAGCAEISAEACFAFGGQVVAFCSASSSSSLPAAVSSSGGVSDGGSSSSGEGGSSSSLPPVMVLCELSDGTCPLTLIPQEACVTFGGTPVPSCAGSSSSALPSSSSIAPSSSSSAPLSSSSIVPSSSSSAPLSSSSIVPSSSSYSSSSSVPAFVCTMAATTGTVGVAITPVPVATCNGSTVTAGLAWTPANLTPTIAGSLAVSVSASSGVCSGMAAQCGSVTVSAPTLACTMTATTGTVGTTITPAPAVTCNGSTVTAGLAWTPASLIPTAAGSVPVSVSASSGVCSGRAAQCGSVTVSAPIVACTVSAVSNGSVTCGGQTYKTVVIGTQTWFAENLNYAVEGSKCNGNNPANCDTYGSLYDWATAMNLPSSCNSGTCSGYIQSKHQGICPSGWHIPSDAEWNTLTNYVGFSTAGAKLKATSGWNWNSMGIVSGNGTDEYGFSALPGGGGGSGGSFSGVGDVGNWWSAYEYNSSYAYNRIMNYITSNVFQSGEVKSTLYSVRCLQD